MRLRTLVLPAVFALLLAACGEQVGEPPGDTNVGEEELDEGAEQPGEPDAAAAPVELPGEVNNHGVENAAGGTVVIETGDFFFAPTFVETLEGADVSVDVVNEGDVTHTFTVDGQVDEIVEPGERIFALDLQLPPGEPLRFYCRFHVAQGMQGAFFDTVEE